jgi:sugar lactone lactonase YvrE
VTEGTAGTATFFTPYGVAVDTGGYAYVADQANLRIRKITPTGVVSTLAGTGASGATNGTGDTATFSNLCGVAVDQSGHVYVADTFNHLIRKISPAGVVSTLAGTAGYAGAVNDTGTAAKFNNPNGVAVDNSGYVYVADTYNNQIRKISPTGVVSTLAGASLSGSENGTGTAARFYYPYGVAVDKNGTVYATDYNNQLIRKISPAGVVSTLAGVTYSMGSANGTGGTATFLNPFGVAVDDNGYLYVSDYNNHQIRKISPTGVVSTLAGLGGELGGYAEGSISSARFNNPTGIALDTSGNVYVADSNNNRIRKITPIF